MESDQQEGPGGTSSRVELKLSGTRISPGLARGTAWVSGDILECNASTYRIEPYQIAEEMERIRRAFAQVETELEESALRVSEQIDPSLAEIFHAHLLMLESLLKSNEFETEMRESSTNAAGAVKNVFRKWEAKFAEFQDETFRQKADDILDLARRVLRRLEGSDAFGLASLPAGSVLVTERLLPSDVIAVMPLQVKAIVVEVLGYGSHAALLARENGIPVLAGFPELFSKIRQGDEVLVDAFRETLFVWPGPETIQAFEGRIQKYRARLVVCMGDCGKPAITRDGQTISVEANLTAQLSVDSIIEYGADGVGLFRIEQLYLARQHPPSEQELFSELKQLLAPLRDKPVTIRLLDVGGDKQIPFLRLPFDPNPLLGKRGVRILLDYPELARTQMKAFLRLSQLQEIRVLVPMVTFERELLQIREMFAQAATEIGVKILPPLGAMIETPAAALTVGDIAKHSDFLSVGTNDLTQYTLVAGRDNVTVTEYYQETHSSMFRLLQIIVAEASGKPVSICGELAAREEVLPTLLQIGYRAISIAPSLIPTTKQFIRSIDTTNPNGAVQTSLINGDLMENRCTHLKEFQKKEPRTKGCEECLKSGDSWVHLRLCESCGHVGCCDSSQNKHATKHYHVTKHPVIKSLEPGEEWGYCYADDMFVERI